MQEAGRTPWDVLGVAEGTFYNEVKRAFFRRARATHPDAPGGSAGAFREVQAAFETLQRTAPRRDTQARRVAKSPYDSWLCGPQWTLQWADADPSFDDTVLDGTRCTPGDFSYRLRMEISRLSLQAA